MKPNTRFLHWIDIICTITILPSFLTLIGSIYSYYLFTHKRDPNEEFMGTEESISFITLSVSGILFFLLLLIFIYLLVKKIHNYKCTLSLVLCCFTLLVLWTTFEKNEKFWKPFWDSSEHLWVLNEKDSVKYNIDSLINGWQNGNINNDSLKKLCIIAKKISDEKINEEIANDSLKKLEEQIRIVDTPKKVN